MTGEENDADSLVPVLGLDALSSAAYGPEAALTVLLVAGSLSLTAIWPIMLAVITLLFVVYLSYLQTPSGPIRKAAVRTPSPGRTWASEPACWLPPP